MLWECEKSLNPSEFILVNYHSVAILAGAVAAYVMATLAATLIARCNFPLPPEERRIGCIDGLRGYLALSVLIHHFIIWFQVTRLGGSWSIPSVNLFNQFGAAGVALFFMTTGLVFYPRVLAGFRACSWLAVYTSRVFRIVPLVVVSVVIVTVIIAMRTGRGLDSNYPKAAALWVSSWSEPSLLGYPDSGRINAYVLWSLWNEWMFYLLMLPVCALLIDFLRPWLPTWVLPVALLLGIFAARAVTRRSITYLPLFVVGMFAYEISRRAEIAQLLRSSEASIVAAISLGVGMIGFQDPYGWAMPLFGIFFACVACGNDMGGLLRTRGALVLGECSYGIYLLHGILLSLVFVDAGWLTGLLGADQVPVLLPLVAVLMVVATSITFLLVERPAIRAGRWVARL